MDASHSDDRLPIILAALTVLTLNKDRLSIDAGTIQELSKDIARKVLLFRQAAEELDQREQDQKRKTWGMLLQKLSDEALLASYFDAVNLMLEQEFIDLLLIEILNRKIDISAQELPAGHSN